MQLPSLNIQSVRGQTGIQSQRPHIQIQNHKPNFSIKQDHAFVEMSTQQSKLTIDQREAFASANSKHVYRLNEEFAAKAMSNAHQAIAKYAREGDQLMRIENGGDVIPHLAKVNSVLFPEKGITLGQMPKPFSVKVQFQRSKTNYRVNEGGVHVQAQKNVPTIQHRPWQTDVYVRQKQSIQFKAVGLQFNQQR
ncbi:hypothetical protein BKP45_06945 [Anaerobacillus alkalidiazotrophicus]|uniref:Uncharacterized protein n=1 Tax=Anaerobacillus alkalidiazotrophicus TaxID=472963 RepID=A0A1S2MCQ8_9BACI|nr:DUF6470 family protein [Anaerobacillus alkalidiazotrophicus]OIJ22366.1 hypothetical protein BKP45_06945 [Anaerobacillus alkalidiazotrophicus]